MGIEPTSSAWKADILADVLYPQLQKELYHIFSQMSSMNLGGTPSVCSLRGNRLELPQSAPVGRSQPPLGWGLWHGGKVSG